MSEKSVLLQGDCLTVLKELPDNSVDSLVTDPPAGISFMGKDWDSNKGGSKEWIAWMESVMREALRVLKPGAHGLVWAIPRTSHWTATALERAGFEIRDVVTHLFGTGFPKSLDISKAIDKAAGAEREVVASKKKLQSYGRDTATGYGGDIDRGGVMSITAPSTDAAKQWAGFGTALKPASEHWVLVRKPCSEKTVAANVLKWGCGGLNIDASRVASGEDHAKNCDRTFKSGIWAKSGEGKVEITTHANSQGRFPANLVLDEEAAAMLDEQSGVNASRFFYVAKASKSDKGAENSHPTVKSTALMRYLCKLVTPPGGIILDPFMGSGSTGVAATQEGFAFIGIEREDEYYSIANKRINEAA